jgi:hypothetical protein
LVDISDAVESDRFQGWESATNESSRHRARHVGRQGAACPDVLVVGVTCRRRRGSRSGSRRSGP